MSEWIKCSDRMPDRKSEILFFSPAYINDYGDEFSDYIFLGYLGEDEHFYPRESAAYEYPINVTHWIELPKAPK